MKYAVDVTINFARGEKHEQHIERGAWGTGIALNEIIEKNPKATSFVLTVTRQRRHRRQKARTRSVRRSL